MRLSEFISEGKLTRQGIDLIENYAEELRRRESEIKKLKKSFAYSWIPSLAPNCHTFFESKYYTKHEIETEIRNNLSKIMKGNTEELIKVNLDMVTKVSFFNSLPWYKRIFKTI